MPTTLIEPRPRAAEPSAGGAPDGGPGASTRRLRILLYGLNFAPEPTGIGRYSGDMCAWLAEQGHEVAVVTGYPYYPYWRLQPGYPRWAWSRERWGGVLVLRCPLWVPRRPTTLKRIAHLLSFAATSAPAVLHAAWRFQPDIVFAVEPTSFCAPGALLAARLTRAKAWLHVQDVELGAAGRLSLLGKRTGGTRPFISLYGRMLRAFDQVTTLSRRMRGTLARLGRAEGAIALFPNWVDTGFLRPTDASALRAELEIAAEDVVLLYAGNLGEKQGVHTLVDVARHIAGAPGVKLVIVGQGARHAELADLQADGANVIMLPPLPEEKLPTLLSMADVHLLPQRSGVTRFVFPSKLAPMLASGRPVVAQADEACAIRSMLADCGLATSPDDGRAFLAAIDRLVAHPELRAALGANARRRAELTFDRSAVLGALVGMMRGTIGGAPAGADGTADAIGELGPPRAVEPGRTARGLE